MLYGGWHFLATTCGHVQRHMLLEIFEKFLASIFDVYIRVSHIWKAGFIKLTLAHAAVSAPSPPHIMRHPEVTKILKTQRVNRVWNVLGKTKFFF